MMDLRRKGPLTHSESIWLCSALQCVVLDEIFRGTGWSPADSVFHGGTSISLAWGSPRFSEDIDLMVCSAAIEGLGAVSGGVFAAIRHRISLLTPGAEMACTAKEPRPGRSRTGIWDIRWSHPMRLGAARVRTEFMAVNGTLLAHYRNLPMAPTNPAVRVAGVIPAGDPVSLWADKIKAIGTRPEFKMRDGHDLGFISALFDRHGRPQDGELRDALDLVCRIHGVGPEDVADGVRRCLEDGTPERFGDFADDMRRWFDARAYASMSGNGILAGYWERMRAEMEIGHSLLRSLPAPAPGNAP